jgi:hypothetical protein
LQRGDDGVANGVVLDATLALRVLSEDAFFGRG